MKVLITGCAGFIGFHVAQRLLSDGFKVIGIDNINDYYDQNLKRARLSQLTKCDHFDFVYGSIENRSLVEDIFIERGVDIVIHLAAQAGVRYSIDHPHVYIESNIVGFMNILEASRRHKIKHFLYASSSSVYGLNEQNSFSVEDRVDQPISLYAATKRSNELMAFTYSHLYGLPTTGLRFFTVYGPWGRPDMALFKFTQSILKDEPIQVYNYGRMERDFTYVDDVVESIRRLMDRPPSGEKNAPYVLHNIGNNGPVSLENFIGALEKLLGKKAMKEYLPLQPGDVPKTYAETGSLIKSIGFTPQTPVEKGVAAFVKWYMDYFQSLPRQRMGVVGLGYVGLPLAVALCEQYEVVGYDTNLRRVKDLRKGIDVNKDISSEKLATSFMSFTEDPSSLSSCEFIFVTVPTPVNSDNKPDLNPLRSASAVIGNHLSNGCIVIYESTVYPGATEEVCIPILEEKSGLKEGRDFFVGYSPERVNPGDHEHTLKNVVKVVAAEKPEILEKIASVYQKVIERVHKVGSIKVAEASKIVENTQRDINIAFVNELSMLFTGMGIDSSEVFEAAKTKWNFSPFKPGLVGGHCISVDPYYLIYKAEELNFTPSLMKEARNTNERMPIFIANSIRSYLLEKGIPLKEARVTVLGVTFKEGVSDIRNSKVFSIVEVLKENGIQVQVSDPLANQKDVEDHYNMSLDSFADLERSDVVLLAVPHEPYKMLTWKVIENLLKDGKGGVFDLKRVLDHTTCPDSITYWGG
ncbi:nucleotide sugar dehydrogenase [Fictibacillus sp. UD]|uniref:nucleotide sugar dehydrogenase n=1 Tax=Fictibacillus sp. UD TaxID=3038777 RepID=UPI0037499B28